VSKLELEIEFTKAAIKYINTKGNMAKDIILSYNEIIN